MYEYHHSWTNHDKSNLMRDMQWGPCSTSSFSKRLLPGPAQIQCSHSRTKTTSVLRSVHQQPISRLNMFCSGRSIVITVTDIFRPKSTNSGSEWLLVDFDVRPAFVLPNSVCKTNKRDPDADSRQQAWRVD